MEKIVRSPRFRAEVARDRGFLSFYFSMEPVSALCRRGLSLGFFVKSPLARHAFVTENCALRKNFNQTLPAANSNKAANTLPGIAAGEPRAMNRCIDAHGPVVWAIVRRYLKDNSEAARGKLVAACQKYLTGHEGTVFFSVGKVAGDLTREVNDRDFDVALHVVFKDKASHDKYQEAARHKQFIAENSENWKKVRVFDSYVEVAPR